MRNIFQRLGNIHIICVLSRCRIYGQRHLYAGAVVGGLSLADGQAQFAGGRIDVIVSRKDRFNDVIAHVSGIFAQRIAILDIIIAVLRGVIPIKLKLVNRNQITGFAVEINHQRSGILNRITTKHTLCLRVALPVSNTRRSLCNGVLHAGDRIAHGDAGGVGTGTGGERVVSQFL